MIKDVGKAASVIMAIFIGIFIGLYMANYVWPHKAADYREAKHQYDYCPYCGEYIGE